MIVGRMIPDDSLTVSVCVSVRDKERTEMFMKNDGTIFRDHFNYSDFNDAEKKEYIDYDDVRIDDKDTIHTALQKYRRKARISERKLADEMGIPKSTVQRYLNGTNPVPQDILAAIIIILKPRPSRQRQLYALAGYIRPDGTLTTNPRNNKRSEIIGDFLDGCHYVRSFTLAACNRKLMINHFEPLTNAGIDDKVVIP